MYIFNKITVNPQLPERIKKLSEIATNVWWAWNTDFLKLFKTIDIDLIVLYCTLQIQNPAPSLRQALPAPSWHISPRLR